MVDLTGTTLVLPSNSIPGNVLKDNAEILTGQIKQRSYATTDIAFNTLRTWDSLATSLPATSASDDLGLYTGTPGTDAPTISTGDVKATTSSRKLAFEIDVPPNFDSGESFEIRVSAATLVTVADTSCTVDLSVYAPDGAGAVGSDLVTTAAQDINSLTPDDFDFAVTSSGLAAGDKLIAILTVAYADSATATAVTPTIFSIQRRCDTRG